MPCSVQFHLHRRSTAARLRRRAIEIAFAVVTLAFFWGPSRAQAAGDEANRIVAEIAEQFLEPRAAAQLKALLALEGQTKLAAVANWADDAADQHRDMQRWHYVEIPLFSTAYDARRDCRNGTCVVMKLEQFSAVLRDKAASPAARLEALKYVVSFAADIHQPTHTSDARGARGGGDGIVMVSDGRRVNLRNLWDDELLSNITDTRATALDLANSITNREQRDWRLGNPADWANESHAVAKGFVYRYIPASNVLSPSYEAAVMPVAMDRLRRAGVRLANILNRSLA
jgi:hypothetical protein